MRGSAAGFTLGALIYTVSIRIGSTRIPRQVAHSYEKEHFSAALQSYHVNSTNSRGAGA